MHQEKTSGQQVYSFCWEDTLSLFPFLNTFDTFKSKEVDNALMRMLDSVFILFLIFGTLAAVGSFSRLAENGTQLPVYSTIIVFLSTLAVFLLRRRIPAVASMIAIVVIVWCHAITSFISLGLASMGIAIYVFILVFVSLFVNFRASLMAVGIMIVSLCIIGLLICKGVIQLPIDANHYLTNSPAWLSQITYFSFLALCTVTCLGMMKKQLLASLHDLRCRTEELVTANKKLLAEQQRIKAILEAAPVSITTSDLYGNITMCNKSTVSMHGYGSESEVIGKSSLELLANEEWGAAVNNLAKARCDGVIKNVEYKAVTKDGTKFPISLSAGILRNDQGELDGFIAVTEDLTKRLDMEERIRQYEKLQAIGQIAGGVAHDFNNMLSAIIGYAELVMLQVKDDPSITKNVRQILTASDRAKKLANQILVFSRRDKQRKELFYLKPVISEVLCLLKATVPASVKIVTDISKINGSVCGDSTKIHEVIMNLVCNSVYAMREKGVLTIRLHEEKVLKNTNGVAGVLSAGDYVVVEVGDTGCGMDNETLRRAFEPFFTTKPAGQGTGMGLSVVLGIVQSHGGNIIVHSSKGAGSVFQIYIPRIHESCDDTETLEVMGVRGSEKVLLVDDEPLIADMTKTMLETLGYSVVATTNSEHALELFKNDPKEFDLIITDQTMPEMTGVELACAILEIRPQMPIILCTGYSTVVDRDKALAMGIKSYYMKPFSVNELSVTIRDTLEEDKLTVKRVYSATN
jgi:PAS domain S-box-containing protein